MLVTGQSHTSTISLYEGETVDVWMGKNTEWLGLRINLLLLPEIPHLVLHIPHGVAERGSTVSTSVSPTGTHRSILNSMAIKLALTPKISACSKSSSTGLPIHHMVATSQILP